MTTEIARIIAGFSRSEMELYLALGGHLPACVERDWLRSQEFADECLQVVRTVVARTIAREHKARELVKEVA